MKSVNLPLKSNVCDALRDKLRESILVGLGWTIHRVWSTDWWERPAEELARIETAIEAARLMIQVHPLPAAEPVARYSAAAPSVRDSAPVVPLSNLPSRPSVHEPVAPVYEPFAVKEIKGTLDDFYDVKSDSSIRGLIEAVVGKEGPISLDLAARRVAEHWGAGRITTRTVKRIDVLAAKANIRVVREKGGTFLWVSSQDPKNYALFRIAGEDENSKREPESLPSQEVANAALHLLEQHVSLPVPDLVREVARLFGYQRTGPTVDKAMRSGIELLVRNGGAKEENGMVVQQ